jgi:hypothetical protein
VHVLGGGVLDGAAPGGQQDDQGAAAVGGVGLSGDQSLPLQVPDLVGEPALLPLELGAQFARGHVVRGVLREHREELVVGLRQPGFLEQELVQAHGELVVRVHEGPPCAVFAGAEPVRFCVLAGTTDTDEAQCASALARNARCGRSRRESRTACKL